MFGPLLLVMAQAAVPQPAQTSEIVVTGRRAQDGLAACLARNCPPAQEVEASLQASVELFAGGRYATARQVLQRAIRRNKGHAAAMPGPISSLYATLATVAEHEGEGALWKQSARNNMLVLRRHLGESDPATLTEEIAFADNLVGLKEVVMADGIYAATQRRALASGRRDIASGAAFRRAWLALQRGDRVRAERFANESVEIADKGKRTMQQLRDILHAQIAIRRGDKDAVDQLAARLRQSSKEAPRLIYSRAVTDLDPSAPKTMFDIDPWHDSTIRFADVGYWIRPDGRTADIEILRDAGLGQWKPAIVRQVVERRYVPSDLTPGDPGTYRIDRFTVRGTIGVPTGSRIRQRVGGLTVHIVDLTETEAMQATRRQQTASAAAGPAG